MNHTRRNIRAALDGLPLLERIELGQLAARWTADVDRPKIDGSAIALGCLVAGDDLETAGGVGPYASAHQRRAWAAGMLRGAIYQMAAAYHHAEVMRAKDERIAKLERKVSELLAVNRAAWRSHDEQIPLRDPKSLHHGKIEWAS